jgi:glucokinase
MGDPVPRHASTLGITVTTQDTPFPSAAALPHPVLLTDIGGTNARFAMAEAPGVPIRVLARLKTADYPDVAAAVGTALGSGPTPRSAILCAAGPIDGRSCVLTNCSWRLEGPALADALRLEQGLLLNDFEALALSLPAIGQDMARTIGPDRPHGEGVRLVLGPGTGLGIGALVGFGNRYLALPSEGCHVGLAAQDDEAANVLAHHEHVHGRLTAEAVLSGPGLLRLHRARAAVGRFAAHPNDGAVLVGNALADPAGEEAATVRLFLRLLAAYAGDMALVFSATGGVFLGGGILPRLLPLIDADAFRMTFEHKAPVDWLVRRTPVRLILSTDTVLTGMAAIAAEPGRYVIDYDARLWRG